MGGEMKGEWMDRQMETIIGWTDGWVDDDE